MKTGRTTIAIGPNFCYKIVTWGKVLNGTFAPSTYQGGYDSPQKSAPILDRITFTRSGQFSITDDNNYVTQKGRYTVSGAALTLVASDGKRSAHSLHVFAASKPSPTTVFLNGRPFFIEKKERFLLSSTRFEYSMCGARRFLILRQTLRGMCAATFSHQRVPVFFVSHKRDFNQN